MIRLILIVLLLVSSLPAGQNSPEETWAAFSFSQDLPYGFDLQFTNDIRYKNTGDDFKRAISEISLSYRVTGFMDLSTDYRFFTQSRKIGERRGIGSRFSLDTGDFEHQYRVKYQKEWVEEDGFSEEMRHRYTIRYEAWKLIEPFVYYELYTHALLQDMHVNKTRTAFGADIRLTKANTLKVFYLIREVKETSAFTDVLGIQFEFEIKSAVKKKKKDEESDSPTP